MLKWLRRRKGNTTVDPSYPSFQGRRILPVPGGRRVHIVGESHHQRELEQITGGKTPEGARLNVTVLLTPEPENPRDPKALAAYIEGKHVGYFSSDDAIAYHALGEQLRDLKAAARCRGQIRGGWRRPGGDEGAFGVVLDIAPPHHFHDHPLAKGTADAGQA